MSRPRRLARAFRRVSLPLLAALGLYVALVQLGVVPSPFAPVVSGDLALARSERPGLRILFVGNSFTSANSLPQLVGSLAAADEGGPHVYAVGYTADGARLERWPHERGLSRLLQEVSWDVVVLQEQSRLLSLSAEHRDRDTFPFARDLDAEIGSAGARTLLFLTWGYEDGDDDGDTFFAMQRRLERGYGDLGARLSAPVAPVGLAWSEALRRRPGLRLWARDGRHPSRLGSYLAACVFYAVLTGRDPSRSAFTAGLPEPDARFLRRIAADVTK